MLLSIWGHLFPPLGLRSGSTAMGVEEKCLPNVFSTQLLQNKEALCFEWRINVYIHKGTEKKDTGLLLLF